MKTIKLNSGHDMPMVGMGTFMLNGREGEKAVAAAIDYGYRAIDCAYIYGNEIEVGAGIKTKLDEGKVTREELFITSKLWSNRHRPEDVLPTLKESLKNLGLSYLDLYLVHWPQSYKPGDNMFPTDADGKLEIVDIDLLDTWKGMEACVDAGLVKSIGVSNYNSQQVQYLLDNARIPPANLQIEVNPYFSNIKLVEFCLQRGVTVTAYSPFGAPARPRAEPDSPNLLHEPKLLEVASRYRKTPAQVDLQWLLQRGVAVVPKSVTPSRIQSNFQVLDFELSTEDMDVLYSLNTDVRGGVSAVVDDGRNAPHFPFGIEF